MACSSYLLVFSTPLAVLLSDSDVKFVSGVLIDRQIRHYLPLVPPNILHQDLDPRQRFPWAYTVSVWIDFLHFP